jgi:hypothetical protein
MNFFIIFTKMVEGVRIEAPHFANASSSKVASSPKIASYAAIVKQVRTETNTAILPIIAYTILDSIPTFVCFVISSLFSYAPCYYWTLLQCPLFQKSCLPSGEFSKNDRSAASESVSAADVSGGEASDFEAFVEKQTASLQKSISNALASENWRTATIALRGAIATGAPLEEDFFDSLCAPVVGIRYNNCDARDSINCHKATSVNREVSRDTSEYKYAEKAVDYFMGGEGKDFFKKESISDEELNKAAAECDNLVIFKDLPRDCKHWSVVINGEKIDMDSCAGTSSKDAAKFLLQQLRDSSLDPEGKLNALKSVLRYPWMQGEFPRAIMPSILDNFGNDEARAIVLLRPLNEAHAESRTAINITKDGTQIMCCTAAGNKRLRMNDHINECASADSVIYLTAFTDIKCDPEGECTILNAMTGGCYG